MKSSLLEGIKFGVGILLVLITFFGIVFAVGFHSANEIIGGVFQGNFTVNGTLSAPNIDEKILLNTLRISDSGSLSVQYLGNGIVDSFNDATGIDDVSSINYSRSGGKVNNIYQIETWNPSDISTGFALSGGNLVGRNTNSNNWEAARGTVGVDSGKYYWEIDMNWDGTHGQFGVGVANLSWELRDQIGTSTLPPSTAEGWMFLGHSPYKKKHNDVQTNTDCSGSGEYNLMVALDMNLGHIWFGRNGVWCDSGNPATGANPMYSNLAGQTLFPIISLYYANASYGGLDISYRGLFNSSTWGYSAPSGFSEINQLNGDLHFESINYTATTAPTTATITITRQDLTSNTLNTDFKAFISADGGTNWDEVTLSSSGNISSTQVVATGTVTISNTGTDMKYRLKTYNDKKVEVYGVGLTWD